MAYLGMGTACSVRVGTALGAGDPARAVRAAVVSFAMSLCFGVTAGFALYVGRRALPALFVPDAAVDELAAEALPIVALYQWVVSMFQLCCFRLFARL